MQELKWFYLSFVDNKAHKWLGATCVEARDNVEAIAKSWIEKCNPGGEVLMIECTEEPPEEAKYKILTLKMVEELFGPVVGVESLGT